MALANEVDDDIRAFASSRCFHSRNKIFGLVVHRMCRAVWEAY